MRWRSSESHWGALAKLTHWLTAIFIFTALAVILYGQTIDLSADREHQVPLFRAAIYRHEAFGILALATIGLRAIWRLFDRRPTLPTTMRRWELVASHTAHGALYVLAIAACILGWYQVSSNGGMVQVFGWTGLPRLTGKDAHLHAVVEVWHEWVSWALVALVAVHIAAALKHHLIDRDQVLRDMLPFVAMLMAVVGLNARADSPDLPLFGMEGAAFDSIPLGIPVNRRC